MDLSPTLNQITVKNSTNKEKKLGFLFTNLHHLPWCSEQRKQAILTYQASRTFCHSFIDIWMISCWVDHLAKNWREWSSGLRRCNRNRKVAGSNPTKHSVGLRGPTSLQNSRWTLVNHVKKCSDLTSGEWDCILDDGPKLAVGLPNSN